MDLTVILSTYNAPCWLEKVLWGFSVQTYREFELIVADDGSTTETKEAIDRVRGQTSMTIGHVWHEDRGFRKCEILNKAILAARHEYLMFTDGDCIPRADFLAEHAANAQPGCFLTGSAIRLPISTSQAISREDIQTGRCFEWRWLRRNGLPLTRRNMKIMATPGWARFLNRLPTTRANFTGGNASAHRKAILAANGFDHRMAWGGEDRDVGVRLKNLGLVAKRIRYSAHVLHLAHERPYADPGIASANRMLRKSNEKNKVCKTEHGINLLLQQDHLPNGSTLTVRGRRAGAAGVGQPIRLQEAS